MRWECECCLSSPLWDFCPKSEQEKLMFPISEQSYCSVKHREFFLVLLLMMEMGEKKPGQGRRQSNEGIALYSAEDTGLCALRLPTCSQLFSTVSIYCWLSAIFWLGIRRNSSAVSALGKATAGGGYQGYHKGILWRLCWWAIGWLLSLG